MGMSWHASSIFKIICIINYLNMCVEILTALKIKLNCYDTFWLGAQNLRAETLMLNEIRSRDNWMNKNLILSLNWYYGEEQKKYAIRDNLREMTEVHRAQEKNEFTLNYSRIVGRGTCLGIRKIFHI